MTENTFGQAGYGTQIRRSPFYEATLRWGAKGFSVYNHMYIPRDFGDPEQNFNNLINEAILCDVGVERQVEISGKDATRFMQYLTPRNLSKLAVGQCKYILITNEQGGILNDPVLLRMSEDRYWISLADSDILLWAQGVAVHSGMEVNICEPDVSPVQVQGPKSQDIMLAVFGESIADLRYFHWTAATLEGMPLIISRTGWSSEFGYEIFINDSAHGDRLWEHLMAVGGPMGLHPGHTSSIRRIEGGMLSYHADMNIHTNPYELGLGRLVDLEMPADFVGKAALRAIKQKGITRSQVGIRIDCPSSVPSNNTFWKIIKADKQIGYVTSAIYSPRLKQTIALAMMDLAHSELGTTAVVEAEGNSYPIEVVPKPFYDPNKKIAVSNVQ